MEKVTKNLKELLGNQLWSPFFKKTKQTYPKTYRISIKEASELFHWHSFLFVCGEICGTGLIEDVLLSHSKIVHTHTTCIRDDRRKGFCCIIWIFPPKAHHEHEYSFWSETGKSYLCWCECLKFYVWLILAFKFSLRQWKIIADVQVAWLFEYQPLGILGILLRTAFLCHCKLNIFWLFGCCCCWSQTWWKF